ncbi:sulfurtransferase/chromate resistance protein [Sphingomonas sp. GB1N7]|uniref:sulfurtransferase/chromate resistance protein n=1 Tax=Parasphingomonas caseinilytica TaxID=3096158 RepID=UPI002FC5FA41
MPAPNAIGPDKLARLIGGPATPILIDVREDRGTSRIPGARPHAPGAIAEWSGSLVGRSVVVIDTDGSTAQGIAAWLRAEGVSAEALAGGHAAWAAANLPLLDTTHLPPPGADGRTTWVTRARPKVDRIACPWLIRRFVDPEARFLFVPPADVLAVAQKLGGDPFDVDAPGVFWSHRDEKCTFDVMIEAFGLSGIEPLAHLATIVRGADTDRLDIVPEAAGLLAISLGLSRLHADDLAQLDAGMLVYDALYRWCRDARGETHDWVSHISRAKASA